MPTEFIPSPATDDNTILSNGDGSIEELVQATHSRKNFQISKPVVGFKRRGDSSGGMEPLNMAMSDPVEADNKTAASEQRPWLRHEPSRDQDILDENSDSDCFDMKHVKSPLEDRRLNARRRAKQAILFTSLVEDRLAFLEEQFQRLQQLTGEDPIVLRNFKDSFAPSAPSHAAEIKRMTWAEWKSTPAIVNTKGPKAKHNTEVNTARKNVLEVLIEDPQANMRRRLRMREKIQDLPKKRLDQNEKVKTSPPLRPDNSPPGAPRVPERLRIRSSVLLEILEQVTDIKLPSGPQGLKKLVLLRPFKLLFTFEAKIRARLRMMEEDDEANSNGEEAPLTAGEQDYRPHLPSKDSSKSYRFSSKLSSEDNLGRSSQGIANDEATAYAFGPQLDNTNTTEGLEHLRLLVEFMDKDLKPLIDLRKQIAETTLRKIAFADLWHLFEHGQEVRAPGSEIQLYRVLKFTGGREILDTEKDPPENQASIEGLPNGVFILECFYYAFDGVQYGPVQKTIPLRRFEGERDINTLPVYPLVFDHNREATQNKLIQRGHVFANLSQSSTTAHKQYSGLTLDEPKEEIDSQIIVDFQLAFIKRPDWKPDTGVGTLADHDEREYYDKQPADRCDIQGCCGNDVVMRDYEIDELSYSQWMNDEKDALDPVEDVNELEDVDRILLPFQVYGFILRSRKWATFNIDLVKDVEYTGGWSDLVLPSSYKETVLALVQNHARGPRRHEGHANKPIQMDLVSGKGKGLIILLHGEPGVGKTSTAECVADHTKRPLFGITCGDIGDNAAAVEENLENNFQLAHKWGCVLLLDEADVFLRKRDKKDMTRNAIVSVFLRTLEYYSGILFLTTNRVGTVDQAFKSRIHVSLLYRRLDRDATLQIWRNHLTKMQKQFKKHGKSFEVDKKSIMNFARSHYAELRNLDSGTWNGRQIRNAFQTAIALAEYDAGEHGTPSLAQSHFKKVADASKEFDIYLKNVFGGQSDAHIARMEQSRIDDYSPGEATRRAAAGRERKRMMAVGREGGGGGRMVGRGGGGGRSRELELELERKGGGSEDDDDEEEEDEEEEEEERSEGESESESRSGRGVEGERRGSVRAGNGRGGGREVGF